MDNQLIPINEQSGLLAIINPEIASGVYNQLVRKDITRVSDMYMSRYGVMGYAEYNTSIYGIHGVILFPKKLSLAIQFAGESVWKEFQNKHFDGSDISNNIEKLSDPRHYGVRFLDEIYFWMLKPDSKTVSHDMVKDIKVISATFTDFMKELDKSVDEIRGYKSSSTEDFSRLQSKGFLIG